MEYLNIAFDEKNSSRNLHRLAILIFLGICHEIAYERANGKLFKNCIFISRINFFSSIIHHGDCATFCKSSENVNRTNTKSRCVRLHRPKMD